MQYLNSFRELLRGCTGRGSETRRSAVLLCIQQFLRHKSSLWGHWYLVTSALSIIFRVDAFTDMLRHLITKNICTIPANELYCNSQRGLKGIRTSWFKVSTSLNCIIFEKLPVRAMFMTARWSLSIELNVIRLDAPDHVIVTNNAHNYLSV